MAGIEVDAAGSITIQPDIYRGQRVGQYEIVSLLTQGGMAELFLATMAGPGGFRKFVVVKRILPDIQSNEQFVQMFMDEARLTAGFGHPNIPQVFELGQDAAGPYMVMEFVAGQNLNQIAKACQARGESLPVGLSLMVARDLCEALHYAHTFTDGAGHPASVIHRDVAQKNVMVTYDGMAKLLDFGIAKARIKLGRTNVGVVKGTTGYMSPEQVQALPLDGRSDLFGVGVVVYELLLQRRLFAAPTEREEMEKVLLLRIPDLHHEAPHLPAPLCKVVMTSLARHPEERFATGRAMARAIEAAAGPLLFDRERAAAFMRTLFQARLSATQALLDAAADPEKKADVQSPLKVLSEDKGDAFPVPAPTAKPTPPPAAADTPLQTPVAPAARRWSLLFAVAAVGVLTAATVGWSLWWIPQEPAPPSHPPAVALRPFEVPAAPPSTPIARADPEPEVPRPAPNAPAWGTLSLVTNPPSRAFVDGNALGRTPLPKTPLPAGDHLLRLVGPDGHARLLAVVVVAGQEAHLHLRLADLPVER